jgi:cold shock CspA family protein
MQSQSSTIYPRVQAQIKFFNRDKGFGFLKRPNKPDIFLSGQALLDSGVSPFKIAENDVLEFDLVPVEGKGGKARNIRVIARANKGE